MSNSIALISLVVLIAVIAVGFVMKKNVGLIAVLAAWIFDAVDRKSTRLNSSHSDRSRMPSSA